MGVILVRVCEPVFRNLLHSSTKHKSQIHGGGGGGGGGGGERERGELGGNFGTGVRASISKPTPFIYLAFEKTDPFIY